MAASGGGHNKNGKLPLLNDDLATLTGGRRWRRDDQKIHVDEKRIDDTEEKTDADDDVGKVHH